MTKADAEALSRIAAAHGMHKGIASSVSSVSFLTDPGAMCALLCAALARAMDAGTQFTCVSSTNVQILTPEELQLTGSACSCVARTYFICGRYSGLLALLVQKYVVKKYKY
jgi:hypothetical protein